MFRNNNNENWEAQLKFDKTATQNIRELHEKVTSLAKELGYEYKSRAVEKWEYAPHYPENYQITDENMDGRERWKKIAVLEWGWERISTLDRLQEEVNKAAARGNFGIYETESGFRAKFTPKKSSKKKTKKQKEIDDINNAF